MRMKVSGKSRLQKATIAEGDGLLSSPWAPVNHKRVYRIMQAHNLLLARKYLTPEHVHDGKVIVMWSNLRWCLDGFEFTCWNGDIVRGALIDAHDR